MLRLAGAAMVLGACGWLGWSAGREARRRTALLRELADALEGMARELAFRLAPLPQLLGRQGERGGAIGAFFRACRGCALAPEESFEQGWRRAAGELAGELDEAGLECLLRLGGGLGRCGEEGEAARLESAAAELRALLERAEEADRRRSRVWTALGLTAGALAVILLI